MYRPTKTEWLIMGGLVFVLGVMVGSMFIYVHIVGETHTRFREIIPAEEQHAVPQNIEQSPARNQSTPLPTDVDATG